MRRWIAGHREELIILAIIVAAYSAALLWGDVVVLGG
jgi:hypothetical protein